MGRWMSLIVIDACIVIVGAALTLNVAANFGSLQSSGSIGASNDLGGIWGNVILAFAILTLVFSVAVWGMSISKIVKKQMPVMNVTGEAALMAIAAASYNLFMYTNFSNQQNSGSLGPACPSGGECKEWSGNDGRIVWALNVTAIVLNALMIQDFIRHECEMSHVEA